MACWLCGFETTELATNAKAPMCKKGCQICTAVAKVDEEIDEAVAVLRRLLAERCDLRSEQNRAHDAMQRLPVEIRSYTFELVLPRRDEWGGIIRDVGAVPSHLSSVCRSWRDTACSNPFLWSTIRMALGRRSVSEWIDFVHNQVLHSGTLPLTFCIEDADHTKRGLEQSRRDLDPVLDILRHCSNRLRSLSLDFSPSTLRAFHLSTVTLLWHRLTQLRMTSPYPTQAPDTFLNPTASPEKIELKNISIQPLRISWNRLTFASVDILLEDLPPLFQHASQMTECHIWSLQYGLGNIFMSPIIHHRLKILRFSFAEDADLVTMVMDSLTLPCLQQLYTNHVVALVGLPALVYRSSCPLTNITLMHNICEDMYIYSLKPLPSVTDLFLETQQREHQLVVIKKLLLEGYFPNLRHLTLQLQPFLSLWEMGIIPSLLDRKRLQPDGPNEGRLSKILVIEKDQALQFDRMWDSDVGGQLKALGINLREDGFELL